MARASCSSTVSPAATVAWSACGSTPHGRPSGSPDSSTPDRSRSLAARAAWHSTGPESTWTSGNRTFGSCRERAGRSVDAVGGRRRLLVRWQAACVLVESIWRTRNLGGRRFGRSCPAVDELRRAGSRDGALVGRRSAGRVRCQARRQLRDLRRCRRGWADPAVDHTILAKTPGRPGPPTGNRFSRPTARAEARSGKWPRMAATPCK